MSAAADVVLGDRPIELTRRFAVDGVELSWDRWGAEAGVPLVLGHGFSGSAQDFALEVPVLASGRPVVTFDRRGHGTSTKTGDAELYTIDRLVADEIAFLEAHADGPVDLLGHSMGGRVVLEVVLARPDLVRSLILMDTSAWSFRTEDEAIRTLLTDFFETFDPSRGLPDMSVMRNAEDDLIDERVPAAVRDGRLAMQQQFDPYAMRDLGRVLFGDLIPSLRHRLPEISCPVTVIVGELDHPLVGQAPDLAAEVADGELVVIDGAYHSPQLTHPAEWLAALDGHHARAEAR